MLGLRTVRRFCLLSASDRRLLIHAFWWVGLVRIGLIVLPWRTVRDRCLRTSQANRSARGSSVAQIVWAVHTASRRIPGGRNCLVRALAAQRLLVHHGHPSQLRIGVRRTPQEPFAAHAWIEHQGQTVLGATQLDYVTLA